MKMRKRIAALIAVAMIAALMPMTAFAASTNRVSQIVKVTDGGSTSLPQLKIELKDEITTEQVFYLRLDNAKWDWDVVGTDAAGDDILGFENVTANGNKIEAVKGSGDKELAITIGTDSANFKVGDEIIIPLKTNDIKGEATVQIVAWDTPITEGKYVFATSSDKKALVTVGDAPAFYTGSKKEIAKITLEESALNAFADADNQTRKLNSKGDTVVDEAGDNIEITLDNDDYEFDFEDYKITLGKGFSKLDEEEVFWLDNLGNSDKQRFVISMKDADLFKGAQRGTVEIELKVKSTTKRPELGDLEAEIGGSMVDAKDYVVATIAEYGVELKSEKDYEFVAGQEEKVEFHLNEIVDDSMVNGRVTDFILPEGVYFKEVKIVDGPADAKNTTLTPITLNRDGEDDKINGFSVKLPVEIDKKEEFKFEAKLEITAAYEGDIILKAEGRSIGEELEVKLAEVVAPVKVTVESMKVKPGFKEQVGGKIIIEETDKARLMQGKEIVISLDKEEGMSLKAADIAITSGDLRESDFDVSEDNGEITLKIKRRSKVASTIEITNVKVKLDRTVPQGFYDINVGGTAISQLADGRVYYKKSDGADKDLTYGNDNILGKQFIIVGDPITGVKSEVAFTIGSEKFLVDGVVHTMDAAAYIKDGRTMVPLRYLATALGIDTQSIKFNSGVVTIFVGNGNVVQVQVGSKDLRTNGMVIPMVAAAEIIDGRTYVPVTEIGGVFGVSGTWDAATQTATFK